MFKPLKMLESLFLGILLTGTVYGQTTPDVREILNQSSEQIREAASEAGLSDTDIDQLTEKLKGAEASESGIQEIMERQEKLSDNGIEETESNRWVKRGDGEDEVRPFGYDVFNYSPRTFEPQDRTPVDPEYPIGPGDEIIIYLWGDVELAHQLIVNRDGKVFIPKVGMLYLNGLTLQQVREKIKGRMSQVYSGINKQRVWIDVSLGKIKRIRVYVHGEVEKPGGYYLSSMTTVFHALYYSGGPTRKGTLRGIKLIRDDKVLEIMDVYQYLTTGEKKGDVRLQNDDILLIPPIGRTVTLTGAVFRQGRYELTPGENLKKLLDYAGGLVPKTYSVSIHITRNIENEGAVLIDVNLEQLLKLQSHDFPLEDGDLVDIPILETLPTNYVNIEGQILKPGQYELKPGMTVSKLITSAGGVLKSSYTKKVEVSRIEAEAEPNAPVLFELALNDGEGETFVLKPFDHVYIRKRPDYEMQHSVMINGEVWFPGTYALDINKKERISDLITRAGGLKEEAFVPGLVFRRVGEGVIDVALEKEGNWNNVKGDNNLILRDGDSIAIPKTPQTVEVSGQIFFPANLVYNEGGSVEDYIKRAGGFRDKADKRRIVLIYPNGRIVEVKRRFLFFTMNADVMPGSRIFVPIDPSTGIDWRGVIKDITSILTSIAMTALVIQRLDK